MSLTPAKSGVGIGVLENGNRDNDTPRACFLSSFASSHLRIMVGRAGPTSVGPVDFPGNANPVRLTTPDWRQWW
ncbi:ash family protein [Salmonella enterica]|nr:ash family protein [Salmonella enterica subsp. enterica serovar Ank]EJU0544296.1 ash family protein [Salmonella enterica]MBH0545342.1 ash family protein [Salmonella enterica]MBH0558404.1 ash family protein [Salmonella enterica]MBH0589698.1 ash family protein [Salmonella enterica]